MSRWTFVFDISGPPDRSSGAAHLLQWTIAGVAVQTDAEKRIRMRLAPVRSKWVDASEPEAELIRSLLLSDVLCSQVLHVTKSQDGWTQYKSEGDWFVSALNANQLELEKRGFRGDTRKFKPELVVRHHSIIGCSALLTGLSLRLHPPRRPSHRLSAPVEVTAVIDNDFQGLGNELLHKYLWECGDAALRSSLGLAISTRLRFRCEQEEPLLMLPDYLAGCFRCYEHMPKVRHSEDLTDDFVRGMALDLWGAASVAVHTCALGAYPLAVVDGDLVPCDRGVMLPGSLRHLPPPASRIRVAHPPVSP